MKKTKEEQLHNGHRERLTDLVLSAGMDGVTNIQSVEFFLTYIFPRGDVNPLAHRLLSKFGTFANIIDADISDLITVNGINKRAAKKIKLFGQMIEFYTLSKLNRETNLDNYEQFYNLLESLLKIQSTENLFLFTFDSNFNLIQKRRFGLDDVRAVGIPPIELISFVLSTKASYLIVAHNHPNGTALPSQEDIEAVGYITDIIKHLQCKLLDSFIVGIDGIYSILQQSFARSYPQQTEKIAK